MYAIDTSLFYSHRNIKELFQTANSELRNVNDWCFANKLFLNTDKTKYIFLHKQKQGEEMLLCLQDIIIDKGNIDRVKSMKFPGILIYKNLNWRNRIELVTGKICKI